MLVITFAVVFPVFCNTYIAAGKYLKVDLVHFLSSKALVYDIMGPVIVNVIG